jgi:imidazolonepropionase-like amidohydrolase
MRLQRNRMIWAGWATMALLAPGVHGQSPAPAVTAFIDVNVVTMDSVPAQLRRVVLVENGRILRIGDRSLPIPAGALRIEGQGTRWLMPGLVDMHVHMFDRGEMVQYLANGITTVRNLHGLNLHLAWRDSLARGLMTGPRLLTAGPILDGDPPTRGTNTLVRNAAEAVAEVDRQAAAGFDWIKVYDNISPEAYAAVSAAAARHRLPVAGHVPTPVTLAGVLAARQRTIEHVEELLPLFGDGRSAAGVDSIARAIAAAGVAVTPTIVVYQSALDQVRDWTAVQARPAMAFLNPTTRQQWGWDPTGSSRSGNPQGLTRFTRTTDFFLTTLVPALHRAGVVLLAGSDAPIPAIVPGFGFHEELVLLGRAGLSPSEVLRIATRNAAIVSGADARRGRVREGQDADLLLLESDPRTSLDALQRRVGVMVAGRWHAQQELDAALSALRRP